MATIRGMILQVPSQRWQHGPHRGEGRNGVRAVHQALYGTTQVRASVPHEFNGWGFVGEKPWGNPGKTQNGTW